MLKLLYKTLLISVLSGSMLLLNFSYNGFSLNSAYAESVKTEKIENKNLMATLTMSVVGVLAKRLYTYKPTTDIMLAAAGGAIFIAGEVLAFFKLKKVIKGMEVQITRDKNGNINKEQIESIERLKKSYEEAKKTANVKKTLQMAAAAAFAAAGLMAYKMTISDVEALKSCNAGIMMGLKAAQGVKAQCKILSANQSTAPEGARCSAELGLCTTAVNAYKSSVMGYELGRQATGPSLGKLKFVNVTESQLSSSLAGLPSTCNQYSAVMASPVSACNALVPNNIQGESGGAGLITPIASNNIYKNIPDIYKQEFIKQNISERQITNIIENNLLEKTLDLFFPQANAEIFSAMGIASKAAILYLIKTSATIGPAIDTFMLIPQKRAIVWGVLAGLTATATMSTNKVIAEIDSNIEKIDTILKSMYSMADGAVGSQITPKPISNAQMQMIAKPNAKTNALSYQEVDLSNLVRGSLPCATGPEGQDCKSFEDSTKNLPYLQSMGNDAKMQMDSVFTTASGLSGTSKISSGTLESATKLGKQASAIKSEMEKTRSLVMAELKNNGSAANLDADTKSLSDQMENAVKDNLNKSKMSANDMAANISGAGSTLSSATASDDAQSAADAALLAKNRAATDAAMAGSSFDLNAGSSDHFGSGTNNNQNGGNGELSAGELAAYNAATKSAGVNMNDYDLQKTDISNNTEANIFELISHRYLQSGYPRLFRIKDPTLNETPELIKK